MASVARLLAQLGLVDEADAAVAIPRLFLVLDLDLPLSEVKVATENARKDHYRTHQKNLGDALEAFPAHVHHRDVTVRLENGEEGARRGLHHLPDVVDTPHLPRPRICVGVIAIGSRRNPALALHRNAARDATPPHPPSPEADQGEAPRVTACRTLILTRQPLLVDRKHQGLAHIARTVEEGTADARSIHCRHIRGG